MNTFSGSATLTAEPGVDSVKRQVLVGLLTAKLQESRDLLGHYIRAFTIFVAVTGATVTFALNERATPDLRLSLLVFGGALTGIGFLACFLGEKLRRAAIRDIDHLSLEVGVPPVHGNLLYLKYTVLTVFVFLVFEGIGWIYLVRSQG